MTPLDSQVDSRYIDTFAIDNKSPLRSAAADETDVIITQENGNLLFKRQGAIDWLQTSLAVISRFGSTHIATMFPCYRLS